MSWRPITATIAALSLALPLSMALPGVANADDPPQPQVESRAGTAAPAEVSGLAEPAASADPVAAAKAHLADPRYHLNPADLVPLHTVTDGRDQTVRFAQRYKNLPVLGGQYLVHLRDEGGQRQITGAGGRFQTGLDVDATPRVSAARAGEIALARLIRDREIRETATAGTEATGGAELVVLPRGKGLLAWHLVLRGDDVKRHRPVLLDAYVDAHSGRPLFAIDRLRFEGPAEGSGRTAHGADVPLNVYQRADGGHELRDRARPMWNGATGEILTYDANKADVGGFFSPGVPAGTKLAESPTPVFGPQHTETGAVDAHWGSGKVYEFYRNLGREGLDGKGGTMYSVVNVTYLGRPFENAFWDGTKMVYGGGGPSYHSFAAGLDVVGHEMTHGVITNSADLVYLGQSGAMNEGLADYFGNAVEIGALGVPMSHPDASLLGDRLCKSGTPAQCALRDLDDDRVAAEDYLGVTVASDNGGVHLNSTIFSGALWDVREKLGTRFDKVVYKALTEYMTPLDDFVDGRRAVESAARAAGLSPRDRLTVALAFERHGIRKGWERRVGADSRVLVDNITDFTAYPDVAGDRYVVSNSSPDGARPTSIVTGRVHGGRTTTLSDDDRWNYAPATDGRQAVWASYDNDGADFQIRARPLTAGTPSRLVARSPSVVNSVVVSGDAVAWDAADPATRETEIWLKRGDAEPVNLTPAAGVRGFQPSIKGGKLAYVRVWVEGGFSRSTPVVYDLATGKETVIPEVPGTGRLPSLSLLPIMTSDHVVWYTDTDRDGRYGVMRAAADGTGTTAVVPDGPKAPQPVSLDANDTIVTIGLNPSEFDWTNASLPKLFQVPVTGGPLERLSCNQGEQSVFASGEGRRVVWIDGTAGDTDLVTRDRLARHC
ncbi:M4 family metallopeptidase [Nonomuraea sp. NN258]|uniref:M4 family metallopeptidase n=1 Tax=Nonomuraea antri TaxID=2730852 RepID=UPI001569B58C|nr:M4 family metallopeptidase [Nonomuraea antri]NRQ31164.1 M4 family metallopeptidase [Nonomuraea antri]